MLRVKRNVAFKVGGNLPWKLNTSVKTNIIDWAELYVVKNCGLGHEGKENISK